MLRRACLSGTLAPLGAATAGLSLWRGLATKAAKEGEVLHNSMSDGFYELPAGRQPSPQEGAAGRPLAGDAGVRQARGRQPGSSIADPPLLHDSMSGADYDYLRRRPAGSGGGRISSITEPDYYLQNSLSEGSYDLPKVLQRSASLNPKRGQGFATAGTRQRPTMQRIVVANRSAAQEPRGPLHNSFSHGDYVPGTLTGGK